MAESFRFGAEEDDDAIQVLWRDGERVLCRGSRPGADGEQHGVLAVLPTVEHPSVASRDRLAHEYALKDALDGAWAAQPLALEQIQGRTWLILDDPGGGILEGLLGGPMAVGGFLRLARGLAEAVAGLHRHGMIHKDIKPAHVLVDPATGKAWLTGFGIASRLPREQQPVAHPEEIAGTLAYMAPEQTGRMNRSIDTRSDLYALGVTLYRMLTGVLPFTASDPLEWVHCHVARQPIPPANRLAGIPVPVSDIVMKLLAKAAEDRYQTAAGLEADLRRCLAEWNTRGCVSAFAPGAQDVPDRLLIPEKLYGREREIETLLTAFDRVVAEGTSELVLVSGFSGVGKSSVVGELQKMLVPQQGLFGAGKFDQFRRDIPYATIAQAFQGLIRPLLSNSDAALAPWREALQEAVGQNGQLIVNLVPELALIIGEQSPVPEVPLQDQQARFQLVFRRFLGVFARPEHPLVVFIDDLQWLDPATLDLIEYLVTDPEVKHLLLVGAYRDNEVDPAHALVRTLATIRAADGRVREIVLAPLRPDDVARLLADALRVQPVHVRQLAGLVFDKTAGNPFFAIQFLLGLADEALLAFDSATAAWTWDLPRIRAKEFTDNVADFVAAKLRRLPPATQKALAELACLGNVARTETLALVHGEAEDATHAALWEAVWSGLVLRSDDTYRFLHDRIREAAYSLIPDGEQAVAHLRIARMLLAATAAEDLAENIFGIVNHFGLGTPLIATSEERERVAQLYLMAGKRARVITAYDSASQYSTAGHALLGEAGWEQSYRLMFDLELNRAECEYLSGDLTSADERLGKLSVRAQSTMDAAAVTCVRINLYTTLDQSDNAISVGLDYLRLVDNEWPRDATEDDVRRAYDRLWQRLGSRSIESLIDLPPLRNPERRATMDVLTVLSSPAFLTEMNLFRLVVSRMATLSLEYGNSDGSCLGYEWLGSVLGTYFGEYEAGFRFARLGLDLIEKRGLDRFKARVYLVFAVHVAHWTQPLQVSRSYLRRAFQAALDAGDLSFAAYSCIDVITNRIANGDPLSDIEQEAEHGLQFARKLKFGLAVDCITGQLGLIRMLRGLTRDFGSFNDAEFDERSFEQHLDTPQLVNPAAYYWIRKMQASVHATDPASAMAAQLKTVPLLWATPTQFELAEYHFYAALACAEHCDPDSREDRPRHLAVLTAHHGQLAVWARNCPATFANRAALVGAEIARLAGRDLDAMRLYEDAIRLARAHGFIHNEGLAHERAARFCAARGFQTMADAFLRNARDCFLSWGAYGKVRQLDQRHPHLRRDASLSSPTTTIDASTEHLDLATMLIVSQAVSSEIVLDKLLATLLRTALEHAGAERGLLILSHGIELKIVAEAITSGDSVTVQSRGEPVTAAALPQSVLHYVQRTLKTAVLYDAAVDSVFAADPYIQQRQARSILCLPLLHQTRPEGLLYLENNLAPRVFAPARIAVLELLASQAAISLEISRLYRDLAEREARIKRLVDANIIGISIRDLDGRLIEANDAFLGMLGYDRAELAADRMRWPDLTPPEWHDRDALAVAEFKQTGRVAAYEKEYFRKDGTRVPVLVGVAAFDETGNQGVTFALDLTERKRTDQALRGVQMELAHANRLATMGQLTASIAHEVNQPVAAIITNAQAGLRWLDRQSPNLKEARETFKRMLRDGNRAGDVIGRIRALVRKSPPRRDFVDINAAVRDVIELTRGEAAKHSVLVRTDLADGLPPIEGDRVQLQQILLNLIVNAIEAMSGVSEETRDLQISTIPTDPNGVLVAVRDSGPGLDPETADHLFEGFYTTKPDGLGMGLAICQSIVEAHGGRLWAGANEPRGAVFQFILPIGQAEGRPAERIDPMPAT